MQPNGPARRGGPILPDGRSNFYARMQPNGPARRGGPINMQLWFKSD
jgi:hypothetical protein